MSLWLPKRGLVLAKLSMDKNGIGACCCGGGGCERCTGQAPQTIAVDLTFPAETWNFPGPGCDLDENNGTYNIVHANLLDSGYWTWVHTESCVDTGGSNCCLWGDGGSSYFPCEVTGFGGGIMVGITEDSGTYYLEAFVFLPFGNSPTTFNIHWTATPVEIGTEESLPACSQIDEELTLSYDGHGTFAFSDVTAQVTF